MWAIDLGNSNTGVARWDEASGRPRLVELPGVCRHPGGDEPLAAPRLVPSATLGLGSSDWLTRLGRWPFVSRRWLLGREALIGRPALEAQAVNPQPGFVQTFKPYLGRAATRPLGRVGRHALTARDVARLFFRELLAEIRRTTGERIRDLVVTTPVEAYESYRAELLAIGRRFGIERMRFIDEPVAAALGYGLSAARERIVLVVDFGAGTCHLALVGLNAKDVVRGEARVLAKAGRGIGGHHVTGWLLDSVATQLGFSPAADDPDDEAALWRRLMFAEVERVKERVFFEDRVPVLLEPPTYLRRPGTEANAGARAEVTRDELRRLLDERQVYAMLDQLLGEVLASGRTGGVDEAQIDEVLMVGGSTLLPDVYARFEARFGRHRVRAWQPFEAVAFGACAFAADRFSPADFIVHDYAFVTYDAVSHEPEYTIIVPRGTRFPTEPDLWQRQLVPTCSLGEPETYFRLVICEVGASGGDTRKFVWDAQGALHKVGGESNPNEAPVVVPLNQSNPTLGRLDPPHSPRDRRPRLEIAFGVNAERWLVATVRDLRTSAQLLQQVPVVRLL